MKYKTELMEEILTSPEAQTIINYLTPIYGKAYACLWIFQAIGTALDEASEITDSFREQVIITSATWTISLWEKEYGIVPDPLWTLEERKQNILSAIRNTAPINPAKMAAAIEAISGKPTSIVENVSKNAFKIYINGYSNKYPEIVQYVDKMKPAHLIYTVNMYETSQARIADNYKILIGECEYSSVMVEQPDLGQGVLGLSVDFES